MKVFPGVLTAAIAALIIWTAPAGATGMAGAGASTPGGADAGMKGSPVIFGKIIETMDSAGYTYALIESKGERMWLAMPETKLKVGEEMVFGAGNLMPNFKAKSLDRTFDRIIFSPGPVTLPGTKGAHPKSGMGTGTDRATPAGKIKVDKAPGDKSYTVEDVYKKGGGLDNQEVSVRGRVVKVSRNIMGKNWVHIQDGTGDGGKGDNNLVVTTSEESASVGDVVTATGKIAKDKDFGYGYKYEIIMEDAKITK